MKNKVAFERHKINNGSLRTPITFYKLHSDGFEPNGGELSEVYSCLGEVYNPSSKDIDIMNSQGVLQGITINIRNTCGQFVPTLDNIVKINNDFYHDTGFRVVNIEPGQQFIKMILASGSNG